VDELIEIVGLEEKRDSRVTKLSGGQQRRLDLAIGLVGDPELLFLDEPTTGFDPSARREAWQMVRNLTALGKTVLLTTHYMDEAQNLAGRVAVMVAGRIVAEGSPDALARRGGEATVRFRVPEGVDAPAMALTKTADGRVEVAGDLARTLYDVTTWALEHHVDLGDLDVVRPSLEDVYLDLITEGQSS
jgi:ABC-2 type transport system ATP-binding protein